MKFFLILALILLSEMISGMTFGGLYDYYQEWYWLVLMIVSFLLLITTSVIISIKLTKQDKEDK